MATSVTYVRVSWDATVLGVSYSGSKTYAGTAATGYQAAPWSTATDYHALVNRSAESAGAVWAWPTAKNKTWAQMLNGGKVLVSSPKTGGGYQVADPAGSITSVSGMSYTHKVQSSNTTYGTASGTASVVFIDGSRHSGNDVTVTASTKSGGIFVGWSGDTDYATISGMKCTISRDVGRDVTVTANFAKAVTITLSYSANGGTGAPGSQSQTIAQGSSATFTLGAAPTPPRGYSFTGWKIGNTTYSAGDSATISASSTATAQYEQIPAHTFEFITDPTGIGTPATITTSPTRTESGVDYYADSEAVTVQPVAFDGYRLTSVVYYDAANPDVSIGSKTITDGDASPFSVSSQDRNGRDLILKFNYEQLEYTATAGAHTASVGKVSASSSLSTGLHWGDTVTFSAVGTETGGAFAEGYSFAGWYDADGNLKSQNATYEYTVQGNVSLYAKCSVACSMNVSYPSGTADEAKTCALALDGDSYVQGSEFEVVLGESFEYALTLGAMPQDGNWALNCWKVGDDIQFIQQSGELTPATPLTLVAHVTSPDAATKVLTVDTGEYSATPSQQGDAFTRNVPKELADGVLVAIDEPYSFDGNIPPAQSGGASLLDTDPVPAGQFSHSFVGGVQYVRLSARPQVMFGTDASDATDVAFRGFYDGATNELITRSASCILLMAGDISVWALYGLAARVDVGIAFVDAQSAAMGAISIVLSSDEGAEIAADGHSASVMQGDTATFRAVPKNGYEFDGWYASDFSAGDKLSANAEYEYSVFAQAIVYAKFVPARDRICLWEGSTDNKQIEWRSKVYVAPKPFDPVAARVDATGYSPTVSLNVGTMSSPNAEPTREHEISIASQDGRRLPRMRPERFVRFTVKSTQEIDAVVIGTNMAEVN